MVLNYFDSNYSFLTVVGVDYEYQAAHVISAPVEKAHSFEHRHDSTATAQNGAPSIEEPLLCAGYLAIAGLSAHLLAPCQ